MRCRTRSGGSEGGKGRRRRRVAAAAAFLAAAAVSLGDAPLSAQPRGRTVEVEVSGAALRFPVAEHRGYEVVDAADLVGALLTEASLGGTVAGGRLRGRELRLRAGSPFFRYGSQVYQLANSPYRAGGTFWVPAELLTRWWPSQAASGALAAGGAAAGSEAEMLPPAPLRAPGPWRVVIDPGHGGRDPGTVAGRGRTREKDVVLGISRRLRDRLARLPDVEPILTREGDTFVTVRGRPNLALARKGDLFVSIHANSAPNRSARGFETYFLGEARTEESRQVALRENAALQYEEGEVPRPGELQYILASLDLSSYRNASGRFGGHIQNALRRVHPGPDRGVKPGPYWVLVGASSTMPTVLVEVGFVSNPEEERFLRSAEGQERIAGALAEAIRAYLDEYGRQLQTAGLPD